jgi:hypothetical protein
MLDNLEIFFHNIGAIRKYWQLSFDRANDELVRTINLQRPPPSKKAKIGKLKVTILVAIKGSVD